MKVFIAQETFNVHGSSLILNIQPKNLSCPLHVLWDTLLLAGFTNTAVPILSKSGSYGAGRERGRRSGSNHISGSWTGIDSSADCQINSAVTVDRTDGRTDGE